MMPVLCSAILHSLHVHSWLDLHTLSVALSGDSCLHPLAVCVSWLAQLKSFNDYAGISSSDAAAQGLGTTPFPASATYATINNKCPECKHCDIDYYVSYPQTMNGRYTISWSYIDCAEALSLYNAQTGGSRKLLRSSTRPLDGPLSQDLVRS